MDQIEKEAYSHLTTMKDNKFTLKEADLVIQKMACILEESATYRPETQLSDMPIEWN